MSNCTTVDGEDVICYRFIFDFVTAAGVTGGIFTLIQFLTKSVNCSVIRYIHTTAAESKIRVSIVVLYVVFLAILAVGLVVFCALGVDSRLYILQYIAASFLQLYWEVLYQQFLLHLHLHVGEIQPLCP